MGDRIRAPLAALGLLLSVATAFPAERYTQEFNRFPDGITELGDGSTISSTTGVAAIQNGALRLTLDSVRSTHSTFRPPPPGTAATKSFEVTFDFLMESELPEGSRADGFSFNYGGLPTDPGSFDFHGRGEEGFGTGLSVEVDTWSNGPNENGYNVAVDNADVPGGFIPASPPVDGVWRTARIRWRRSENGGTVCFSIDRDVIFEELPTPGFQPQPDDTFAFSARTGGLTETLLIDNVKITVPARAAACGDGDSARDEKRERACTVAKLRAAQRYSRGLFACTVSFLKKPLGDADAAGEREECVEAHRRRFEASWQRILERFEARGGCDSGLTLAGIEQIVRETIVDRYAIRISASVLDRSAGDLRFRLMKLGSTYVSKQIVAELGHVRRSDPERRDAKMRSARARFDAAAEKLVAKSGDRGVPVDRRGVSISADLARAGSDDLAQLVSFAALDDIRSQLLAYWNFDEESGPIARNGVAAAPHFHGFLGGNTARAEGFLGAGSLRFDGARDFVRVTSSRALRQLETTRDVTVAAWILPEGDGASAAGGIVLNKEGEFQVARFADGTIRYAVAGPDNQWDWSAPHPVPARRGEWTHVIVSFRDSLVQVYVNGQAWNTGVRSPRGDRHPDEDELWIGDRQGQPQSFHGRIDDVAIWGRPLGDREIRALYNTGEGHPVLDS